MREGVDERGSIGGRGRDRGRDRDRERDFLFSLSSSQVFRFLTFGIRDGDFCAAFETVIHNVIILMNVLQSAPHPSCTPNPRA